MFQQQQSFDNLEHRGKGLQGSALDHVNGSRHNLRNELALCRQLMDHAPSGLLLLDCHNLEFVYANQKVSTLSGYATHELERFERLALFTPQSRSILNALIASTWPGNKAFRELRLDLVTKNGIVIPCNCNIAYNFGKSTLDLIALWISAKEPAPLHGETYHADNHSDEQATEADELICGLFKCQDGQFTYVNHALVDMFGYARSELIGRSICDLADAEERPRIQKELQQHNTAVGDAWEDIIKCNHKNGKSIWVKCRNKVTTIDGRPAIQGSLIDITAEIETKRKHRKSKMHAKQLANKLLTAQETERKKIALELHDTVAQNLSAVKLSLSEKIKQMDKDSRPSGISLESILAVVQSNIKELRCFLTDLRPVILEDLGLLAAIRLQCRKFRSLNSHIILEQDLAFQEDDVPPLLKRVMYRILSEAMNNIAKHSQASRVSVALRRNNGKIEMEIADNGSGFDVKKILSVRGYKKGLGLIGMQEQADLSGGVFTLASREGRGTLVRVAWQQDCLVNCN